MKILLDGYTDKNLGDDLMLCLAAGGLRGQKIYMKNPHLLPIAAREAQGIKPDLKLTVIGSGFLVYNYKTTFLRIKEMLEDSGKYRRAVISCNISDFPNKLAERVIKKQLSRFDFITVRDKYSYDYIKTNLPNVNCEYYPDIVFSLPGGSIADKPCENALGINAYSRLGGNDTDMGFAKLADEYTEKTGNKVLLFALNIGNENDVKTAEAIKGMMRHGEKAEILKYDAFLSNIKRCSALIGIRFHAVVIALRAGVPVIPVIYSKKISHMLEDLNFDGEVFCLDSVKFPEISDLALSGLKPFKLDEGVIKSASMHIKRLSETIVSEKFEKIFSKGIDK